MRNKVMKLGEVIALPAVNGDGLHTMCKYTVIGKQNGGHYVLRAASRFTKPYERVIHRDSHPCVALEHQAADAA